MRNLVTLHKSRVAFYLMIAMLIVPMIGCGFAAQMLYVIHGQKVEAAYKGLKGKRVAVVCVSTSGAYGPTSVPERLARMIGTSLQREVKDIELIHQNKIADWIDNNDWDRVSYKDVGRGVDAEMVVAIDLAAFIADEQAGLYRGQANYTIKVLDMKRDGILVYERPDPEYLFPRKGEPAEGVSGTRFRSLFLKILANDIARDFYDYDLAEDVALNASFIE